MIPARRRVSACTPVSRFRIVCALTSLHLSVSHIGQDTVLHVSWMRGLCVLLHLWSGNCNDNNLLLLSEFIIVILIMKPERVYERDLVKYLILMANGKRRANEILTYVWTAGQQLQNYSSPKRPRWINNVTRTESCLGRSSEFRSWPRLRYEYLKKKKLR